MYLLLDLEAIGEARPEQRPAVVEIIENHMADERHVVRGVAIRIFATLQPDEPSAQGRLQSYLLDPHEPLELRNAVFLHPVSANLPSREAVMLLLHRQAVWAGRSVTLG
jgi:hypothetical protein